jgi:hypothetical protein
MCSCLNDLENVDGFNREGKKDVIYGFKLSDQGMYIRHEIVLAPCGCAVSLDDLQNVKITDNEIKYL